MSDDTGRPPGGQGDGDEKKRAAADPGAIPGWEEHVATPASEEDEAVTELERAITAASNRWLKERFDLVEGSDGALHASGGSKLESFGKEADEFVRGFFRGFLAKTTEELEAERGLRDAADVPRGSEVLARLFTKFNDTVTGVWQRYVDEHARTVDGEKRVDGQFAVEHGAGLIAETIEALGRSFGGEGRDPVAGGRAFAETMSEAPAAPEGGEAAAGPRPAAPKIDVRIDYGSILRALFGARKKP